MLLIGALVLSAQPGEAHKPITSKYTYNDDVFPILKARCAQCHVPGGVAPMSLMTYEEAFPWGESIRAELVAAHMPPAAADSGFGDIKRAHALSPKEIDVLLTWASGGNPRGAIDQQLPKVELKNEWTLGAPDLLLPLPSETTLAADSMEATKEFTIPATLKEARWVRAIDLLPGNPAIVRSATIALKGAGASSEQLLTNWLPGQDAEAIDGGAAFRLPAGAELLVRIRYKKTWSYEGKPMSDRSTIGLYFAKAEARELTPLAISTATVSAAKGERFSFTRTLDQDVQVFAINAEQVPDDLSVQVEAIAPDGTRSPLLRFVTRADWTRRYWLTKPMTLARGTKIEISGMVEDPELTSAAFGGPPPVQKAAASTTLKVGLDVVSTAARSASR